MLAHHPPTFSNRSHIPSFPNYKPVTPTWSERYLHLIGAETEPLNVRVHYPKTEIFGKRNCGNEGAAIVRGTRSRSGCPPRSSVLGRGAALASACRRCRTTHWWCLRATRSRTLPIADGGGKRSRFTLPSFKVKCGVSKCTRVRLPPHEEVCRTSLESDLRLGCFALLRYFCLFNI